MFSLGFVHMIILYTHFNKLPSLGKSQTHSWPGLQLVVVVTSYYKSQALNTEHDCYFSGMFINCQKLNHYCHVLSAVHIHDYLMQSNVILNKVVNEEH